MNKTIVIYKGDEYRAKISDKIYEDELFADLYISAFKILNEIVDELSKTKDEEGKFGDTLQGMGNNIIVFSGQRGQGKTSIMQSFSKWLKNDVKADKIFDVSNSNEEWKKIVCDAKKNGFLVLPTIDPSSLSKGESIVQALITKLFYVFNKHIKTSNEAYGHEQEKRANNLRKEAVPLFQRCFTNVDYLKLGRSKEWEIDDLEELSQISNSAAFKNNLSELIDILLNHICDTKYNKKYLVVPIDDTDLATLEAFNICEDIRNYFSISNVIVLMAADYKQLTYAVTQQYLVNYEKLRTAKLGDGFKDSNCYEIAVQYLEKVLPSGHRIDLPKIDAVIKENREGISFRYFERAGSEKKELLKECYGDEKGIHNRLVRIIYKRTGIIFDDKSDIHPFLPQKMRELTHFVKLLADMEDIDCDQVYLESGGIEKNIEFKSRLEKLKNNIGMLIQYFHDYWCTKHLSISEKETIENFDLAMRNHDKNKIIKILQNIKKEEASKEKQDDTFRYNMRKCVGINTNDMNSIQNAIRIYYTLFMNLWYAETLGNEKQLSKLNEFVEKAVFYNEETPNKESMIDFKVGLLSEVQDLDNLEKRTFYNAFYYQNRGKEVRFSLIKPILDYILIDDKNSENSSLDTIERNMYYFINTRNIVANYDNQCFYSNKIIEFIETFNGKNKSYSDIAAEFYAIFSDEKYTKREKTIGGVLQSCIMNMGENLNKKYNKYKKNHRIIKSGTANTNISSSTNKEKAESDSKSNNTNLLETDSELNQMYDKDE